MFTPNGHTWPLKNDRIRVRYWARDKCSNSRNGSKNRHASDPQLKTGESPNRQSLNPAVRARSVKMQHWRQLWCRCARKIPSFMQVATLSSASTRRSRHISDVRFSRLKGADYGSSETILRASAPRSCRSSMANSGGTSVCGSQASDQSMISSRTGTNALPFSVRQ